MVGVSWQEFKIVPTQKRLRKTGNTTKVKSVF